MVKVFLLALFVFSADVVSSYSLLDDGTKSNKKIHDYDVDKVFFSEDVGKRRLLLSSMLSATTVLGASLPVYAAKGAAEYDFEYYMRDLFMGNKPEGNMPVSNAPPPHPPRNLHGPLLPLLLDDELQSCIPIKELAKLSTAPISDQTKAVRSKVQSAFKSTHPWNEEVVSDEYYFDLTCYALWRVAAAAINDYAKRDQFVRSIGRRILDEITSGGMISQTSINILQKQNKANVSLTDTVPCIIEVLDLFQSTNYCTKYRLGDENDPERTGLNVFDSLDNDELSSSGSGSGSVDCLVSIFDPATLGSALQIIGEGSRFAPDFVGPTLAAVWERVNDGSVTVKFESYFVDPVYRPNPKDFFPNERFYQFTIEKKS